MSVPRPTTRRLCLSWLSGHQAPGLITSPQSYSFLSLGSTVLDLAERIHRDLPQKLAYARVWGGKLDGQRVSRDFELRDRDVVELAT